VFLEGAGAPLEPRYLEAVELELAELGYAVSSSLRAALSRLSLEELARQKSWIVGVLARHRGADQKHKPLFRKFPDAIPESTHDLWVQKVLSHCGVESLIEHPAIMTHASIPHEPREARGRSDRLVRMSVGIKDVAHWVDDLKAAPARA
jgi:hypothetical protein